MKLNRYFTHSGVTIDTKKLIKRLTLPIGKFSKEIKLFGDTSGGVDTRYFYKDNGSNVLAVAHLDTVMWLDEAEKITYNGGAYIISPQLDDRLGAYILLDVLPSLGIHPDILLTVGEETCASTAANFITEKKYNWGLSFDRRGDDVVLYQYGYDSSEWKAAIDAADFELGFGSYSDIKELDALGCKFMNIGCGYHNEHSEFCYVRLEETCEQIDKFVQFFQAFETTRFTHVRTEYGGWDRYSYPNDYHYNYSSRWNGNESTTIIMYCNDCGCRLSKDELDIGMCQNCLDYYESNSFEGQNGEEYLVRHDGKTVNYEGRECCAQCQVELMPHEESCGLCDDCLAWEQRKEDGTC